MLRVIFKCQNIENYPKRNGGVCLKTRKKLVRILCVLMIILITLTASSIPVFAVEVSPSSYSLYSPFSSYCVSSHISESDLPLTRWTNCTFTVDGQSSGITVCQSSLYNEMIALKNKYDSNLTKLCEDISNMSDKNAEYCLTLLSDYRSTIQSVLNEGADLLIGINTTTLHDEDRFKNAADRVEDVRDRIKSCNNLLNDLLSAANERSDVVSSTDSIFVSALNFIIDGLNNMWVSLGTTITGAANSSNGDININYAGHDLSATFSDFVDTATQVTKVFGYGIAVICFGIGLTNEATAFELSTERGWFKVFGQLLLAKIWVDVSVGICRGIYAIIQGITVQLIDFTTATGFLQKLSSPDDNGNIFSNILTWFSDLVALIVAVLPLAIISIIIIISICKIYIKLIVRNFELACMMSVSPLFFAALASSSTASYFKRFISSFISVAAQVLWIGITYSLTSNIISDLTSSTETVDIFNAWPYVWTLVLVAIIMFAASNMISKPSRELTGLLMG